MVNNNCETKLIEKNYNCIEELSLIQNEDKTYRLVVKYKDELGKPFKMESRIQFNSMDIVSIEKTHKIGDSIYAHLVENKLFLNSTIL